MLLPLWCSDLLIYLCFKDICSSSFIPLSFPRFKFPTVFNKAGTVIGKINWLHSLQSFLDVYSSNHLVKQHHIMFTLEKKYRDWRTEVKKNYFLKYENDEDRLCNTPPPRVSPEDWAHLVASYNPDEHKVISIVPFSCKSSWIDNI